MDREQSIFCVHNVSDTPQPLLLSDINLIDTEHWSDLLSGTRYDSVDQAITLAPYQSVWITNRPGG